MERSDQDQADEVRKLTLKLLIDSKSQKVLFAEAQKDFVDFLLSLLALPVGTIIKLLKSNSYSLVGCFGNLYDSVENNLGSTYIQPGVDKNILLNPKSAQFPSGQHDPPLLLLENNTATSMSKKFYRCSNSYSHGYVTDVQGALCPSCNYGLTNEVAYVGSKAGSSSSSVGGGGDGGGFVKGVVTYTVMDDLVVKPMSTISSITLLSSLSIKDVGDLEEKVVQVGIYEGLAILKTSFMSKTVLTDIFLGSGMKKKT